MCRINLGGFGAVTENPSVGKGISVLIVRFINNLGPETIRSDLKHRNRKRICRLSHRNRNQIGIDNPAISIFNGQRYIVSSGFIIFMNRVRQA